jgi:hypothetical protein
LEQTQFGNGGFAFAGPYHERTQALSARIDAGNDRTVGVAQRAEHYSATVQDH